MFVVNGQITPGVGIPGTVIKEIVDRFAKPSIEGKIKVSEKKI